MVITENHDDDENYRCDNDIVKASEDSSHDDYGKWFSDDKIILRTITVILPVKIMISNGKK